MELCSDHLKHTGPDVDSGLIVLGGAMLEEPIKEGVPPKMKGSVLMCVADTEEEVVERVKKDVYYTNDVWDKEKVSDFGTGGPVRLDNWDQDGDSGRMRIGRRAQRSSY